MWNDNSSFSAVYFSFLNHFVIMTQTYLSLQLYVSGHEIYCDQNIFKDQIRRKDLSVAQLLLSLYI